MTGSTRISPGGTSSPVVATSTAADSNSLSSPITLPDLPDLASSKERQRNSYGDARTQLKLVKSYLMTTGDNHGCRVETKRKIDEIHAELTNAYQGFKEHKKLRESCYEKLQNLRSATPQDQAKLTRFEHEMERFTYMDKAIDDLMKTINSKSIKIHNLIENDKGAAPKPQPQPKEDTPEHALNRHEEMAKRQQVIQLAMTSMSNLQNIVTTMQQSATAQVSAMCNQILDGVKAINDLMKKGGAMSSGAIGQ